MEAYTESELVEFFTRLGVRNPEHIAKSQIEKGWPEFHRHYFLLAILDQVLDPRDDSFLDSVIDQGKGSYAGPATQAAGECASRLKAAGVLPEDIAAIARKVQIDLLFNVCYLLDDPSYFEPKVPKPSWRFMAVDEDGNPSQRIGGLHEDLHSLDPIYGEANAKSKA